MKPIWPLYPEVYFHLGITNLFSVGNSGTPRSPSHGTVFACPFVLYLKCGSKLCVFQAVFVYFPRPDSQMVDAF